MNRDKYHSRNYWHRWICFFKGHEWKTTWSRKKNYDELVEMDDLNLSYRERKTSGNPYFEHKAWWHFKCTRCRRKIRQWSFESFHVNLWRGITNGIRRSWGMAKLHWKFRAEENISVVRFCAWIVPLTIVEFLQCVALEFIDYNWDDLITTPIFDLYFWTLEKYHRE